MELFERIRELRKVFGSLSNLAEVLGIRQQKLNSYLNSTSQKNLWEYLPKILERAPEISAEWLYMGVGPMLASEREQQKGTLYSAQDQIRELTEANRVLAETNKRLVEELLSRK